MWLPILLATATVGCLVNISVIANPDGTKKHIVGGEEVNIDKVPYQLSFEVKYKDNFIHYCGASIIGERWALTTAFCIRDSEPSNNRIRSGTSQRQKGGQLHKVVKIIVHEKYVPKTYDLDVALLKVDTPFNTSHIISLAKVRPVTGTNCSVSGWGRAVFGGQNTKNLKWTFVPIFDQKECVDLYQELNGDIPITENMICAGFPEGGTDACTGDGGGPLVAEGTQVGIVSWGNLCATKYPGVYTDVAAVREWIAEKTEQDVMS